MSEMGIFRHRVILRLQERDDFAGAASTVYLAPRDLPHQRVHIGEVPDLGELAVL
jgi:hypothetical protein